MKHTGINVTEVQTLYSESHKTLKEIKEDVNEHKSIRGSWIKET